MDIYDFKAYRAIRPVPGAWLVLVNSLVARCGLALYRNVKGRAVSVCVANACTCSNGNGATGSSCPTHNTAKCASCNTNYYLNAEACTGQFLEPSLKSYPPPSGRALLSPLLQLLLLPPN